MRPTARVLGTLAILAATLTAACGGAAAPAARAPAAASPTVAPTPAATPTPTVAASPSPAASPAAPPHAGVGAAAAKLAETKSVIRTTPAHVSFLGEEPSLAPGSYTETVMLVTLQPGGRTVSHRHGGVEWVIAIEGSVEVRMGGGGRVALTVGQTAKVPANTPVQLFNAGSGVTRFLAFFVTAEGQPFQTNLDTVP